MQQVDAAVGALDEQLYLRVLEHVAGQHRPDPGIEQGSRATDTHQATWLAAVALDDLCRALGLHAHGQAAVVVGLADLGKRAVAAGAVQQAHAQALFKVGDASAELRLGHVQRPASRGEAAVLDYLGEVVEGVEVFQ
ncbi:hypothetical protein D3C77_592860 [compost metagenome]